MRCSNDYNFQSHNLRKYALEKFLRLRQFIRRFVKHNEIEKVMKPEHENKKLILNASICFEGIDTGLDFKSYFETLDPKSLLKHLRCYLDCEVTPRIFYSGF